LPFTTAGVHHDIDPIVTMTTCLSRVQQRKLCPVALMQDAPDHVRRVTGRFDVPDPAFVAKEMLDIESLFGYV